LKQPNSNANLLLLATKKTTTNRAPKMIRQKEYKKYLVSDHGIIYSKKSGCWKSLIQEQFNGYRRVTLCHNGKPERWLVHRLVMFVFKGKSKLDVNHKNGITHDNRLCNLEYLTRSENHKHAFKIGLKNQEGIKNNASKMTKKLLSKILISNLSSYELSKKIKVDARTIRYWRQHHNKRGKNAGHN
jgi:hypothetical protein